MSRSLSGIAAGLALGLFSVALTLVIAEWFLRATILPVESVDPFAQVALVADPVIGYRLQPNQQTIMTNGHFSEEVRTDEAGILALEARYLESGMERTSVILPVDAHYGAGGHDVIAAVFAKTLRERGLDEQPPQHDSRAGIE